MTDEKIVMNHLILGPLNQDQVDYLSLHGFIFGGRGGAAASANSDSFPKINFDSCLIARVECLERYMNRIYDKIDNRELDRDSNERIENALKLIKEYGGMLDRLDVLDSLVLNPENKCPSDFERKNGHGSGGGGGYQHPNPIGGIGQVGRRINEVYVTYTDQEKKD